MVSDCPPRVVPLPNSFKRLIMDWVVILTTYKSWYDPPSNTMKHQIQWMEYFSCTTNLIQIYRYTYTKPHWNQKNTIYTMTLAFPCRNIRVLKGTVASWQLNGPMVWTLASYLGIFDTVPCAWRRRRVWCNCWLLVSFMRIHMKVRVGEWLVGGGVGCPGCLGDWLGV